MNPTNLLPFDGEVYYYGKIMEEARAADCFSTLLHEIAWEHDQAIIYGKHYVTARKVAWYAADRYTYKYSGVMKQAHLWAGRLVEIKALAEEVTGEKYNSCLLNLYHSGEEGMAWHSDGEKYLVKHGAIASLSFGAVRKFSFRHIRSKETVSLLLENGSLLLMKGITQENWHHRLPPTKKIMEPRINLTFRQIST